VLTTRLSEGGLVSNRYTDSSPLVSLLTVLRDDGGVSVPVSVRVCYVCLDSSTIGLLMYLALLEYCVVSVCFHVNHDAESRIFRGDLIEQRFFFSFD
jgi:hypothetical protein